MFSTPSKFIFLYSKEKPSLLHQGKTFPSTSRKPKPKLIRNLRQIQKISTLTQITSSNLHSLSKELCLNPSKLSLNNLFIDSTSKPKLVCTSTLNQHQRWLDIIFSLNSPISNLEFWYQLLCNSRSHNINYYDLSLAQVHSHKQENKTSTKDNKI